jgi:hypothetical protein
MDIATVLSLVKARLGISTAVRDTYITAIIESVIHELEDEKGIQLGADNPNHLMFVVDFSTWRYESKGETGDIPRHLQYRLHNMMIHGGDVVV